MPKIEILIILILASTVSAQTRVHKNCFINLKPPNQSNTPHMEYIYELAFLAKKKGKGYGFQIFFAEIEWIFHTDAHNCVPSSVLGVSDTAFERIFDSNIGVCRY